MIQQEMKIICKRNIYLVLVFFLVGASLKAQVKIGDNHERINAGSLLELESSNKGVVFPRVALGADLTQWSLNGNDPIDGMVVFNINATVNEEGLYCWFNSKWNHFSSGGNVPELDTLSFNAETRYLFDDGDSTQIPSGRVRIVDSVNVLTQYLSQGYTTEGDIYYVSGDGIYIRNNNATATTLAEGYIYVSTEQQPEHILYAKYPNIPTTYQSSDFQMGVVDTFYQEPDRGKVLNVDLPGSSGKYYAFAVPSEWATPRIFLKIKNSADGGFYVLNNCWNVTRDLEFGGVRYQVWALNVPMRESVMGVVGSKAQFMIE